MIHFDVTRLLIPIIFEDNQVDITQSFKQLASYVIGVETVFPFGALNSSVD